MDADHACRRPLARFPLRPSSGHNPLRRTSDRVERWALWLTVVLALAMPVPIGAMVANAYQHRQQQVAASTATTEAQVIRLVPRDGARYGIAPAPVRALAQWRTPAGEQRAEVITLAAAVAQGATVRIGLDQAGRAITAPKTYQQIRAGALTFGLAAGWAVPLTLLGAFSLLRSLLERRRLAAWDARWAVVEPQWSHLIR